MIVRKLGVTNALGLHLRAAARLAQTASRFKCKIHLKNHNGHADGKSVINLLSLAAMTGTEITLTLDGHDAPDAWDAIHQLFKSNFGEA
jgi:phosphocarrier protein HPr